MGVCAISQCNLDLSILLMYTAQVSYKSWHILDSSINRPCCSIYHTRQLQYAPNFASIMSGTIDKVHERNIRSCNILWVKIVYQYTSSGILTIIAPLKTITNNSNPNYKTNPQQLEPYPDSSNSNPNSLNLILTLVVTLILTLFLVLKPLGCKLWFNVMRLQHCRYPTWLVLLWIWSFCCCFKCKSEGSNEENPSLESFIPDGWKMVDRFYGFRFEAEGEFKDRG